MPRNISATMCWLCNGAQTVGTLKKNDDTLAFTSKILELPSETYSALHCHCTSLYCVHKPSSRLYSKEWQYSTTSSNIQNDLKLVLLDDLNCLQAISVAYYIRSDTSNLPLELRKDNQRTISWSRLVRFLHSSKNYIYSLCLWNLYCLNVLPVDKWMFAHSLASYFVAVQDIWNNLNF